MFATEALRAFSFVSIDGRSVPATNERQNASCAATSEADIVDAPEKEKVVVGDTTRVSALER